MIRSMTGFGAAAAEEDGAAVRVEARSVNHRYLQVKCRLPGDQAGLEPDLEALVRKRLERGSVVVTVHVTRAARPERAVVNRALAERYGDLLAELAVDLRLGTGPSVDTLVSLPGVIGVEQDAEALEHEQELVRRVADVALGELLEMRTVEGRALEADLRGHAREVAGVVARIRERMPAVVREHHEALRKRLGELLDGVPGGRPAVAEADLARELALLADKTDVAEEVSRLASHLEQLDALLAKGGAVGRRLDFLMQECMREANTIGSKCNDAAVAHDVVELKTWVERLREQVQNVE